MGRESELAQLHGWLDKALSGERQVVFVTGEPGIGKTTLVEAFLMGAGGRGLGVSPLPSQHPIPNPQPLTPSPWIGRGQCIEQYGAGEAYMPVLAALGRLGRESEGKRLVSILRQYAPTWLAQLPAQLTPPEREQLQREVHGTTRERMLRELAEALEVLTSMRPLVLVVEDLHWSDVSTLELLAALARRREAARLFVIGTYRPVEMLANGHPLRAVTQELRAHHLGAELTLPFLTKVDITAYLQTRFPHSFLPPQLPHTLHHRTEGNPLFLVNVVEDLVARGVVLQEEQGGSWKEGVESIEEHVPESIRHLVARQSERLSRTEQQVLAAASVAGLEFSAASVAAALTHDVVAVEEQCTALVERQQFLRRAGIAAWPDGTVAARYGFVHSLYQQLWHERVSVAELQRWNLQIGECKEAAYGAQAGEVATELDVHFEQGRDYRRAVQYLERAGQNALRRSAHQEAITHLAKGLELLKTLPDTPERRQQEIRLQLTLGPSLIAIKGYAALEVEQAYARARELCQQVGEPLHLFSALGGLCTVYRGRVEFKRSLELAEQLLRLAHDAQDQRLLSWAHFALGASLRELGELVSARQHLEQSLAHYDFQQRRSYGFVYDSGVGSLSALTEVLWLLGYPDQALQKSHEALSLARELAHPYSLATALTATYILRQNRGERQAAQESGETLLALARDQGFPFFVAVQTIRRGWELAMRGQGEEGIAQMRQVMTGNWVREASANWVSLVLLAEAYTETGQIEPGLAVVAETLAVIDRNEWRVSETEVYRLKGELLLQAKVQGPKLQVEDTLESQKQKSVF